MTIKELVFLAICFCFFFGLLGVAYYSEQNTRLRDAARIECARDPECHYYGQH